MNPVEALKEALGDGVVEVVDEGTHPFTRIQGERIVEAAATLRDKCGFDMLHQISGVDFADRMEVVYHFTRVEGETAFYCLKVNCDRDNAVVPTLAHEWRSANWAERETWDLCGIRFEGHPLRKDYEMPTEYHGIDCTE